MNSYFSKAGAAFAVAADRAYATSVEEFGQSPVDVVAEWTFKGIAPWGPTTSERYSLIPKLFSGRVIDVTLPIAPRVTQATGDTLVSSLHFSNALYANIAAEWNWQSDSQLLAVLLHIPTDYPDQPQNLVLVEDKLNREVRLHEIMHSEAHAPGQLNLAVSVAFSPSKRLVEMWLKAARLTLGPYGAAPIVASELELQQEFAKMLKAVLGASAQQHRYAGREGEPLISEGARFASRMALDICERFLVGVYEAPEFLELLLQELKQALITGVSIAGAWGHVAMTASGDLVFDLTAPRGDVPAGFEKARRVV